MAFLAPLLGGLIGLGGQILSNNSTQNAQQQQQQQSEQYQAQQTQQAQQYQQQQLQAAMQRLQQYQQQNPAPIQQLGAIQQAPNTAQASFGGGQVSQQVPQQNAPQMQRPQPQGMPQQQQLPQQQNLQGAMMNGAPSQPQGAGQPNQRLQQLYPIIQQLMQAGNGAQRVTMPTMRTSQ